MHILCIYNIQYNNCILIPFKLILHLHKIHNTFILICGQTALQNVNNVIYPHTWYNNLTLYLPIYLISLLCFPIYKFIIVYSGAWRDSSEVKSTDYSSKRPRHPFQHTYGSSQQSVSPVPGYLASLQGETCRQKHQCA